MEQRDFLSELKLLAFNEDVFTVAREVNELKQAFEDAFIAMERREQIAQLEAAEIGKTYEGADLRWLKKSFNEVFMAFKDRLKVQTDLRNALENENLQRKSELIDQLRKTIQEEENIGVALTKFKEIQESWKNVGDIPRNKREEVQKTYSKLLEQFFYNLKIYKELKDHDLKRNQQLKAQVILRLRELMANESVKETEQTLKVLQNEWEDIGPVANEAWDRLKSEYWSTVRGIYERLQAFYDERRSSLQENLNKKAALLKKTEDLLAELPKSDTIKTWEKQTAELIEIQEQWRAIGFGPKKENEALYKAFRSLCDQFFQAKKVFFETVKEGHQEIAAQKRKLIEKVQVLKDSTDWKQTSDTLIKLQKEWKNLGSAGQKMDQRLWLEFRENCDHFFTAKQNQHALASKEFEANLEAKRLVIKDIDSYALSGNKDDDLAALKAFSARFSGIGMVPSKEKEALFKEYKSAIDKQYASLQLDAQEKEKILFTARLETLSASADPAKAYARERSELRHQMEKLRSEVLQLENNLGFFARSKGAEADALRKEVAGKIQFALHKMESLKRKLKLIPNE